MRILYLLATAVILLLSCPPGNSQIEIRTEDHSCEGTNGWDRPACESAWQPKISAVFLGLVTNVEEEGVPMTLNGEKGFVGLRPGRCEVILNADGKVDSWSHKSTLFEIAEKGCARFTFWIDPFAERESNRQAGALNTYK